MKEEKAKSKKKLLYYVILGISVLLIAAATVLTVYFVSGRDNVIDNPSIDNPGQDNPGGDNPGGDNPGGDNPGGDDKPTGGGDVEGPKYVAPLSTVKYTLAYGEIYTNETVGWIYRHNALDFAAEVGAEVYAMADGEVTEVSYNDKTGNYIVVDHGDGLKTLYRFVEPTKGLGKGASVKKGQVIASVAEAYGSEFKDGPHLHFEVSLNGKSVNPVDYFEAVLEEK